MFCGITTVSLKLPDEQSTVTGRLIRGRLDDSVQLDALPTVAEMITVPSLFVTFDGEATKWVIVGLVTLADAVPEVVTNAPAMTAHPASTTAIRRANPPLNEREPAIGRIPSSPFPQT
jgi:hypothetical protein